MKHEIALHYNRDPFPHGIEREETMKALKISTIALIAFCMKLPTAVAADCSAFPTGETKLEIDPFTHRVVTVITEPKCQTAEGSEFRLSATSDLNAVCAQLGFGEASLDHVQIHTFNGERLARFLGESNASVHEASFLRGPATLVKIGCKGLDTPSSAVSATSAVTE